MNYMVCYDVPKGAERIRTKIALTCQNYGLMRIQYSFFWGTLTEAQVRELAMRCQHIAGENPLDIRFIAVCAECFRKSYAYVKDLLTQTQNVVPLNSNAFMNVATHTTFGWDLADNRSEKGQIFRPNISPPVAVEGQSQDHQEFHDSQNPEDNHSTQNPNLYISNLNPNPNPNTTPTPNVGHNTIQNELSQNISSDPPEIQGQNVKKKRNSRNKNQNQIDHQKDNQKDFQNPTDKLSSTDHSNKNEHTINESNQMMEKKSTGSEEEFPEISLSFDLPEDLSQLTDAQILELTGMDPKGNPLVSSSPIPSKFPSSLAPKTGDPSDPSVKEKAISGSSSSHQNTSKISSSSNQNDEDAETDNEKHELEPPHAIICNFEEWNQQGNHPGLPAFQNDLEHPDRTEEHIMTSNIAPNSVETKKRKKSVDRIQTRIHRGAIDIDILFI